MSRALLVLLAALAVACAPAPTLTQIVVVSDTDLAVPAELDRVRIEVRGPGGVSRDAIADLAGGAPRPVTLGLVSRTTPGPLEVDVIGERAGVEVLRRSARVSFVPDRVVALRMDLLRACVAEACGAGSTCGEAGCRAVDVDASELVDWSGPPPGLDAGAMDAGVMDASAMDASVMDAGDAGRLDATALDANVPDAPPEDGGAPDAYVPECRNAADCDDGVACTVESCVLDECVHTPVAASCDDAIACTIDACDPVAGCTHSADVTACDDGIACTVDACDPLVGCRATPTHTSCALGSYCDSLAGCAPAPTWSTIYTTIISARCGPCHTSAGSPGGGLAMSTQTQAYLALVGTTATCGAGANVLVVPRDSARSLLWRKVAGVDLCGALMPRMSMSLDPASIALIARWIQGGALE